MAWSLFVKKVKAHGTTYQRTMFLPLSKDPKCIQEGLEPTPISITINHILYQTNSKHNPSPVITTKAMKSSHKNPESAASAIEAAFRAHRIRTLYKTLSAAISGADRLQRLIQRQETVDAIRFDPRERLRMNESLMALLLRLDSVPGFDPTVREARRKISRRIVGLQEIVDAICETTKVGCDVYDWDRDWCEVVGNMEEEVCRERGGEDMDRFCDQYLGFRCLHRFLSA